MIESFEMKEDFSPVAEVNTANTTANKVSDETSIKDIQDVFSQAAATARRVIAPYLPTLSLDNNNNNVEKTKRATDIYALPNDKAIGEKKIEAKEFPAKFSAEELKENTRRVLDVIRRNEDFGYGMRRDRLNQIFTEAANRGPLAVKQLTYAINEQLAAKGLKLSGKYEIHRTTVDVTNYNEPGKIMRYPRWVDYTHASAYFSLHNRQTGETEDGQPVTGRMLSRKPIILNAWAPKDK